jgi:predicted permease
MELLFITLWPVFLLIAAGYIMKQRGFPGDGFWPGAEKINYFLLFPALLFSSLAQAPLSNPALPRVLVAVLASLGVCSVAMLAAWRLRRWPPARCGVLAQGVLRFNTYLGLAVVGSLFGKPGLVLAAVIMAVYVPVVNVLSVLAFRAGRGASLTSLLLPITRNPLILACVAGAAFNLCGLELKWGADKLLAFLSSTSLPLGLLSVGAALNLRELRGELAALMANSLVRLIGVPLVAALCAHLLALPRLESAILILFFALPTAPTSYVLARQMNGDSHLMAGIITLQTMLSAISLALVLSVLP